MKKKKKKKNCRKFLFLNNIKNKKKINKNK